MVKSKKLKWLTILAILFILGDAALWISHHNKSASAAAEGASIATVKAGSIEDVVTAQGKLEPKDYVDVGAQVSGQIDKMHVGIGDVVKQGDLIAEIDPQVYETRITGDQAQIQTLNAQRTEKVADIKQAQQDLNRSNALATGDAISKQDLEDVQTALTVAQAQLKSLDAQIQQAQSSLEGEKVNLGYTKIFAPMDGTVVVQDIKEGQTINASQTAPVIVQIANLDTMTARAQVAEADVNKLKPDMAVYFTTLGSLTRKWDGHIRQILPSPETVNDVVLYDVLVDVDNKDHSLMTGMTTQMFFVVNSVKDVPTIPVSALGKHVTKQDNDAGEAYAVQVLNGDAATRKIVHIGLMSRTDAEVKDGLQLGDRVQIPTAGATDTTSKPAAGGRGARAGGGPRL